MTAKETKLRIEPSLDNWLNTQAVIAGMAKTKYIIQALEGLRSNTGHTHLQLSPKISPVSPVDTSIYEEVAAIKARLTKLEQGTPQANQDNPQFYKDQLITAQSSKIYNLFFNSINAEQKHRGTQYYLSNELNILCKVVGTSKSNKKKLKVVTYFPDDKVVINADGTFLVATEEGVRWEFVQPEVEEVTAEPTSPVESTNNETPIEAVIEAPAPLVEPVEQAADTPSLGDSGDSVTEIVLSREDLVQRIAKTPNDVKTFSATLTNLGGAKMKPAAIVKWTSQHDPDGKAWMPTDATRITWVMQAAINTP